MCSDAPSTSMPYASKPHHNLCVFTVLILMKLFVSAESQQRQSTISSRQRRNYFTFYSFLFVFFKTICAACKYSSRVLQKTTIRRSHVVCNNTVANMPMQCIHCATDVRRKTISRKISKRQRRRRRERRRRRDDDYSMEAEEQRHIQNIPIKNLEYWRGRKGKETQR